MSRCSCCNMKIEVNRFSLRKNNDLCATCSDIVDSTINDEFPNVFTKDYAFGGDLRDGLVKPKTTGD